MSRFQEHFNSSQHTLSSTSSESSISTIESLLNNINHTNNSSSSDHHHVPSLSPIDDKKKLSLPTSLGRFNTFKRKSRSEAELDVRHVPYIDDDKVKLNSYLKFVDRLGTFYHGLSRKSSTRSQ